MPFPVLLVLCGRTRPLAGDPLRRRARGSRARASALAAWAVGLALAAGCKDDGTQAATFPPAAAYEMPCDFTGQWIGEVGGEVGTLTITSLGPGRYRGLYHGEDVKVDYVLLLEQDVLPVGSDAIAGNRALFTWQDGRGGRGEGWLLINREDSAITGAFGDHGMLDRPWTFIRVE